jgi:glycosyltransferase involved in cell wall biosynthesis
MKIVFLSYTFWPPNFGGELLAAEERLKALANRGHEVIVLTAGTKNYPSFEQIDGIKLYRSPSIGTNKLSRILRRLIFGVWSLWKLIITQKVDILHLNSLPGFEKVTTSLYGFFAASIARIRKTKVVYVHSLASTEENFFMVNIWDRFFFYNIDYVVCVSDGLYKVAKSIFPTKVKKIIYGVQDKIFLPLADDEKDQLRRNNGIDGNDVVFLFIGSVCKRKGFDLIAQVFSESYPQHKNWRLWVVGPRTKSESQNIVEFEVLQATSQLGGMVEAVKFWGKIDERTKLAKITGAADIFLFPSRKEGFGIAPLEAMSAAVPPIVSRILGVTDHANIDGETGIYITPGDKEGLKSAMQKLAENPALRKQMGNKARERIVNDFSWQQHVDRWEQLYLGQLND